MATKAGITWEEFLAAGKEGQRWEYVDGEVVFMTPVFRAHGKTNVKLDYELVAFTRQHPHQTDRRILSPEQHPDPGAIGFRSQELGNLGRQVRQIFGSNDLGA